MLQNEGHVNESWLFSANAEAADNPKTAQEVAMEFTEEEKEEIRRMKGMSRLYDKVPLLAFQTSIACTTISFIINDSQPFTYSWQTLSPLQPSATKKSNVASS
jgi:G3E family GTPase